jgi:hypothetical protein
MNKPPWKAAAGGNKRNLSSGMFGELGWRMFADMGRKSAALRCLPLTLLLRDNCHVENDNHENAQACRSSETHIVDPVAVISGR